LRSSSFASEASRRQARGLENEELKSAANAPSSATLKKKKKKSHSLVRRLSLNKFRLSSEQQETRRTPEGGDSSRSRSQSSQESPVHSPARAVARKGLENDDTLERGEEAKEPKKSQVLELEKVSEICTAVQCKSPSVVIKSFARTDQQNQPGMSRCKQTESRFLPETDA
jgi:hypothetical protein